MKALCPSQQAFGLGAFEFGNGMFLCAEAEVLNQVGEIAGGAEDFADQGRRSLGRYDNHLLCFLLVGRDRRRIGDLDGRVPPSMGQTSKPVFHDH